MWRVNSVLSMAKSIAAGAGAGVLPCFIGNKCSDLTRIGEPILELDLGLWILTHPDLRHSARVRAFTDYVGGELAEIAQDSGRRLNAAFKEPCARGARCACAL